jgi:pimeloyl-ACP methyl ester carboxylesterase
MIFKVCRSGILMILVASISLAAPVDRFFDSAGVQIHWIEEGAGEPVILVHGYTNTAQDWVRVGIFPELAKHYRVIAVDCRGHGRSGKPHDVMQYGAEMGQDIVRLLDHLGLQRAHIVGYSMGGGIVAQLLTVNPDRFISAILGGNAGRREWTKDDEERTRTEADEMEVGSLRHQILRLAPSNVPPPSDEQILQTSARILAGQDTVALAALARSSMTFVETSAQMSAIKVPTLGIVGSLDPSLPKYKELKEVMPQLQLVVIEGAPHGSAPTRPEFIQSVIQFLKNSSLSH